MCYNNGNRGFYMKKICSLIILAFVISVCASACNVQPPASMVKSQRRFAKYVEPPNNVQGGVVDLSEGPKTRYEANFGPKALDFDIKIRNPY